MTARQQHRIAHTLAHPDNLDRLRGIISAAPDVSRHELAKVVCDAFSFTDHLGKAQAASCGTALRGLAGRGLICLPASGVAGGWKRHPRGTGEPVPEAVGVPPDVGDISDLSLTLVSGGEELRIWNELLLRDHPQGGQIITGRQLRYLLVSGHGILGAAGASAAALHLEARDCWIGWDWDVRSRYLDRVVCLSRLLIRPSVDCRNLASRALGMFHRAVTADWREKYGYAPWLLESFVDATGHNGACFRAANWFCCGQTKGRGRGDAAGTAPLDVKDVYVYCLEPGFRGEMGLPPDAGAVALKPGDGLDGEDWAGREFGGAKLGDARLAKRLVSIAALKSTQPTEPFLKCADGRSADVQGYYRFIEHPDKDSVNMAGILRAHVERTVKRLRGHRRVLCPQDSTDLDFTQLEDSCADLGRTGKNQHGAQSYGLRLHSTLALDAEGLPLGIVAGECLAREFREGVNRNARKELPIEEKESYRWLKSVMACEDIADQLPGVKMVCMADREGDIFEVLQHRQRTGKVEMLVRAAQNRSVGEGTHLFGKVAAMPEAGRLSITLPRRRDRRLHTVSPEVELSIRFAAVVIPLPKGRKLPDKTPVDVWIVHALEDNPPPDTSPIEWRLISSEPVGSFERACQCVREYGYRWRIEEWHKVLKSGCKVEDIIAGNALTIERIVAINMVIAWRIMLMTLLGRKCPNLPPGVLFSDIELKILTCFAKRDRYEPPDTLHQAVVLMAMLGGYRNRKRDPPPGNKVLWRGYYDLRNKCAGAELLLEFGKGVFPQFDSS